MALKNCRECKNPVADSARICPQCGAPWPSREKFDGYGFEYKSKTKLFGLPLVHISFKYLVQDSHRRFLMPKPAVGIIAIGQFAAGVVQISQFGVGLISVSQITIGAFCVAQMAAAYWALAQVAIACEGKAQLFYSIKDLLF